MNGMSSGFSVSFNAIKPQAAKLPQLPVSFLYQTLVPISHRTMAPRHIVHSHDRKLKCSTAHSAFEHQISARPRDLDVLNEDVVACGSCDAIFFSAEKDPKNRSLGSLLTLYFSQVVAHRVLALVTPRSHACAAACLW